MKLLSFLVYITRAFAAELAKRAYRALRKYNHNCGE